MTKLIPIDAAIMRVWAEANKNYADDAEFLNAVSAIREAALREAAKAVDALPDAKSPDVNIGVANAYAAILALIGEKK